ncbi:type VI secretion system baseplate subunit TssK, partial [Citrobacter sp. VF227]
MKIYRPLWSEGAFLAPQQFQQQTRWVDYVADAVAHMSLSSPWGVLSAEFDECALTVPRLSHVNLDVGFPAGWFVDSCLSH